MMAVQNKPDLQLDVVIAAALYVKHLTDNEAMIEALASGKRTDRDRQRLVLQSDLIKAVQALEVKT